jgi:hypothetical protein
MQLTSSLQSVFLTAAYCTVAQAPWSLSIGENARIAIEKNPEKAGRIRVLRDFKTLAVSMITTAISVAQLMGVQLADAAMIGVAVTGTANYIRTIFKARKWKHEQDALVACQAQLVK